VRAACYRLALKFNRLAEHELALFREAQWLAPERISALQHERLEELLAYSVRHVPYYRHALVKAGVADGTRIRLDRFGAIPILDKPAIRSNFDALTSHEAPALHAFENRTSGSTGEPLVVLQDRDATRVTGSAVLRLFYEWHGMRPGEREVKVWGMERDLFYPGKLSIGQLREWASGIRTLNAFQMTVQRMRSYIEFINTYRPKIIRGYSANLHELAVFALEHGLRFVAPSLVVSSAGTLFPWLRDRLQRAYGAPVFNHYGSRELHNMAMECPAGEGLHVSSLTHYLEVVDERGLPCAPGDEGDILVTGLLNRSMPLIRYWIGDRGAWGARACKCGRGFPLLARLSGRRVDCFWTKDGRMVPGEYFIYLLAVHLDENPIARYQVVQPDYDLLLCKLALHPGQSLGTRVREEIEQKARLVMGPDCRIIIEEVREIAPTASGKYLYTLCQIPGTSQPTAFNGQRPNQLRPPNSP
jgi:phenylacetate-CoA ligase